MLESAFNESNVFEGFKTRLNTVKSLDSALLQRFILISYMHCREYTANFSTFNKFHEEHRRFFLLSRSHIKLLGSMENTEAVHITNDIKSTEMA